MTKILIDDWIKQNITETIEKEEHKILNSLNDILKISNKCPEYLIKRKKK
jgi:hypothetical protein